jgi:predicted secreted Zn-dependent protease
MTIKIIRLVIFIACFLTFVPICRADVISSVKTEYYLVDGVTKREIAKNLKKQSPIKQNGRVFQGNTKATIKYNLKWMQRGNQCTIKKITIHLKIIYTYPKLSRRPDTKTLKWWKKHLKKLEKHELIHGKIALDGAKALDREFRRIKKYNCKTIKNKIKTLGKHNLREVKKKQTAYDALTEHGLKQERYMGH